MNNFNKYTAVIAGKKISIIASDIVLFDDSVSFLQSMYDNISYEYNNKLDRESIFLFMALKIIHENTSKNTDFFLTLIDSLIQEIDCVLYD